MSQSEKKVIDLSERLKRESENFDQTVKERFSNGKIPDLQHRFFNPYFYNNIWRKAEFINQEYGPIVDWIVTQLKNHGAESVTEYGCGDGWLSLELARLGFKVVACDISPKSIEVAKDYLSILPEKNHLSLDYITSNVMDLVKPTGSVVCFGFLHHLNPTVLDNFVGEVHENMRKNQIFIGVEPTYDKTTPLNALLTYTLRKALPNHIKYKSDAASNVVPELKEVFEELSETSGEQSEMDNESPSQVVCDSVAKHFSNTRLEYYGAFYDKVIGGVRVSQGDEEELTMLLKRLENIITKYNPQLSRMVKILGVKD